MSVTMSTTLRNARANQIEATIGTAPRLKLRTGAPPANVATASSGTVVADMTLPTDWLAAASAGAVAQSGTWQDTSADASGIIQHGEFLASDNATVHVRCLVSEAWQQSKAYLVGQQVHANGNVYRCTVAGTSLGTGSGPSHTTGTAADSGVTWQFLQTGTELTMDNTNVNATQQVTVSGFQFLEGNA